jgi:hypothetical protein
MGNPVKLAPALFIFYGALRTTTALQLALTATKSWARLPELLSLIESRGGIGAFLLMSSLEKEGKKATASPD